jgi:hypothetical protein
MACPCPLPKSSGVRQRVNAGLVGGRHYCRCMMRGLLPRPIEDSVHA